MSIVSWDTAAMLGQVLTLVAMFPTLLNTGAYVPRFTSGLLIIGLGVLGVSLVAMGVVQSGVITIALAGVWAFVFAFRGGKG